MTTVDKLREVMVALEGARKDLAALLTPETIQWITVNRLDRAKATIAKVIEEMEKPAPTPWKSSPPYSGEY